METRGKNQAGKRIVRNRNNNVPAGTGDNRGWQFTPAHWRKWLVRLNAEPESQLTDGIEEFRSLLERK